MKVQAKVQQQTYELEHKQDTLFVNGQPVELNINRADVESLHILHENVGYKVLLHKIDKENKEVTLSVNGKTTTVKLRSATELLLSKLGLDKAIGKKVDALKAPMPGLIHSILVSEGQSVKKGDPLLILEAMKMENIIKAPADLTVSKIMAEPKASVEKGAVLMKF